MVDEYFANERNVHVQVHVINLHGYLENIHHCDFPLINFSKNHTPQFQLEIKSFQKPKFHLEVWESNENEQTTFPQP